MDKRGLGKGLGALLSGSMANDDAGNIREVRVEQIVPNPYQPRTVFDPEKLAELIQSVREHGILQPVLLRRLGVDRYELIAGERRFRAAQEAGLRTLPALVKEYADAQMLEVALIENVQREDINAVEAAVAYQRLTREFGMTQADIARRIGKAPSTVANTIRLLDLPEAILESVRQGEISEGHARTILKFAPEARMTAWENVCKRGLSVRETERMIGEVQSNTPRPLGDRTPATALSLPDPHIAALEAALQEALSTKVHLRYSHGVGKIEIEFYDEPQLEGLIQRLTGG